MSLRSLLQARLVRHSAVFMAAEVLNKALPVLLLPVLTRYLSPADYGLVATFSALLSIVAVFVGLSTHGAVNVAFFRVSRPELRVYIANVLLILGGSAIGATVVMALALGPLEARTGLPRGWLLAAPLLAVAQFVTLINLVLWQAEQRPVPYGAYQIAQTVLTTVATVTLVVVLGRRWEGQLLAIAIGTGMFALLSVTFLIRRGYLSFHLSRPDIRDALAFGVPLIPHALSGWFLTGIDRFFLTALVGPSATGLYSVGYQFGLVIAVLAAAFNKAWMPFLFARMATMGHDEKRRIVRLTYAYFAGILMLSLTLAAVAPIIISRFLGRPFQSSTQFVAWVCVAFAFNGMYLMVVNPLFYLKKTAWLAWLSFGVGTLHVALSYTLIRMNGAVGAAQTTAVSFLLMFGVAWWLSARAYPMPWGLQAAADPPPAGSPASERPPRP